MRREPDGMISRESAMADPQELAVRDKKELVTKEEKTVPARYYVPSTDIYETQDTLTLVMEMPGVEKKDITVGLENDKLRVEGQIDFSKYEGLEPVIAHPGWVMAPPCDVGPSTLRMSSRTERRLALAVLTTERKAA
jgi:hypothetical protein